MKASWTQVPADNGPLRWGMSTGSRPWEHVFVDEEARAGAAAEVARRSRVMAGLDEHGGEGQALEAGIVSALQALIPPENPAGVPTEGPGGEPGPKSGLEDGPGGHG